MNKDKFKEVGVSIKKYWKKFWFLLWKDTSWKGWVFSVVFLFLFIKLIFFPLLSLFTGSALPLAIVESCSMYHDGNILSNYDDWWIRHEVKYSNLGITKEEFDIFKMRKGFNKGDILFIVGAKPEKLEVGDIIIFSAGYSNPIIHRIININLNEDGERIFSTYGDNNLGQLSLEKNIKEEQILGKASFKLAPYLGWGKLIFYELKRAPSEKGGCDEN